MIRHRELQLHASLPLSGQSCSSAGTSVSLFLSVSLSFTLPALARSFLCCFICFLWSLSLYFFPFSLCPHDLLLILHPSHIPSLFFSSITLLKWHKVCQRSDDGMKSNSSRARVQPLKIAKHKTEAWSEELHKVNKYKTINKCITIVLTLHIRQMLFFKHFLHNILKQ